VALSEQEIPLWNPRRDPFWRPIRDLKPQVCPQLYYSVEATNERRLETLSDNEFEKLLDLLDGQPNNYVRRVAELLTPYVESILDGQDYVQDSRLKMDISALINQYEEVIQPSGSILKEARITASLDNDMSLAISY